PASLACAPFTLGSRASLAQLAPVQQPPCELKPPVVNYPLEIFCMGVEVAAQVHQALHLIRGEVLAEGCRPAIPIVRILMGHHGLHPLAWATIVYEPLYCTGRAKSCGSRSGGSR